MKKLYVFCHGFGFSDKYWFNLKPYFSEEECVYLNLGYIGEPHLLLGSNLRQYCLIGIGHSLGLINLLQLKLPFKYLIGLNGFTNFLGNDPQLYNQRTVELKALKYSLRKNHEKALNAFYLRCGLEQTLDPNTPVHQEKLSRALELLTQKFHVPETIMTCIIAADNDIIVPKALIFDNFNDQSNVSLSFVPHGSHALGFMFPGQVKSIIDSFLNGKV